MPRSSSPPDSLPAAAAQGYLVEHLDAVAPVSCPCGQARRAFAVPGNRTATLHVTEISRQARTHYHKTLTEIYYVLEGEGRLELQAPGRALESVPLVPGSAALIRPLTRHRAVPSTPTLRVLIVPVPAFDPADEFFDEPGEPS
jgi:mannose-6-phosphate isomerase-like protein (cupin superfamily)